MTTGDPGPNLTSSSSISSSLSFGSVFGDESELLLILPEPALLTLRQRWDGFTRGLEEERVLFQRDNVVKEQRSCELERDLDLTRQRLEEKLVQNECQVQETKSLLERYNECRQKLASAEETINSLGAENGSLKRERDQLSGERSDLFDLADRRQSDIDRLYRERQTLSENLDEANAAKFQARIREEEVKSREISLEYREKRLEEEREYLGNQVSTLTDDLARKNEEVIGVRREQMSKLAELQSKVSEQRELLRMVEGREAALKEDNELYQKRAEELAEKLKAARDSELKMEENYRHELRAQTKLAELYKGYCDESEQKTKDMTSAVQELQGLLKQSSERYGKLEEQLEQKTATFKDELSRRNEAIRALKKELEDANKLIQTIKKKGLSIEGIEKLSPSAAAASKLLNAGMTLTQVYSQLVACQEELLNAKDENVRLNTYLDQILQEIEERAPILKQQREDYERAVLAVNSLTKQLEDARQEYEFRKREAEESRQRMGTFTRENQRLAQQVKDLNKQVTILVREVEAARGGGAGLNVSQSPSFRGRDASSFDMSVSFDADSIISDRLLGFRDVAELQQRNIELIAVVRELSSKQEAAESQLVEEKTAQLKKELVIAADQVEELRAARQRQEVMVESIIIERDMYKTIATAAAADASASSGVPLVTSTPTVTAASHTSPMPTSRTPVFEMEKRMIASEAALSEVQKEFDIYRQEKCENERLLNEDLQAARNELTETRSKVIKLSSQEEYNTERFKIVQTNVQSFRKQVGLLEERSNQLTAIVGKHEQTIEILRGEILSSQSKLSQAEVQLDFLRHEKSVLKAAETRLVKENEFLNRQKNSSSLVLENLNLIKLNLERTEEEKTMRLQNKNDTLEKEVSLLQKKVENEQENFKQSVRAWESAQQDIMSKLEESRNNEKAAQEEVKTLSETSQTLRQQLTDTQEKLQLAESTHGLHGLSRQESNAAANPEVSAKVRDLQLQLNQSKNEITNLKEQLANSRNVAAQYQQIADSAEKRLTESNTSSKALKDDLEARLQKATEEKKVLEQTLTETANESIRMEEERRVTLAPTEDLKAIIETTRQNLQHVTEQLLRSQEVEAESRAEAERQMSMASEAQQRYERELMQHAQDVETLNVLKSSVSTQQNQVQALHEARMNVEETLCEMKQIADETERTMTAEHEKLQEQFNVVDRENETLHSQLATVTQQMTSLQKLGESNPDANRSFTEEESRSTEQLMQIIKYLRREKEILASKVEVAQAESTRIKSQHEHLQKSLAEARASLNQERERSASSAMSSTKYDELLQRVQQVSVLSDSNRMLRDENIRYSQEHSNLKAALTIAENTVKPLQERLKQFEDNEGTINVELHSVKLDCQRWKARANQLVEKQQKINPDELKRLQDDNSSLTLQISQLQNQQKNAQTNIGNLANRNKALEAAEKRLSEEGRQRQVELTRVNQEIQKFKNNLQTLTTRNNTLTAKYNELEAQTKQITGERDVLKQEQLEHDRTKIAEMAKLTEELNASAKEIDTARTEAASKQSQLEALRIQLGKVKQLARTFKEKGETAEKQLSELQEKNQKLDQDLKVALEGSSTSGGAAAAAPSSEETSALAKELAELKTEKEGADELLEAATQRIEELDTIVADTNAKLDELSIKIDELKTENEALKKKEERFKSVLEKLREEKKASAATTSSTIAAAPVDNTEVEELRNENATQQQRIAVLEQEMALLRPQPGSSSDKPSPENVVTASVKPMSGGPAAGQRKPTTQPQAHIQPTRHMPATATIRPQRGPTTTTAIIRASPSSADVPHISVQPTILSVSPNASQTAAAATMMAQTGSQLTTTLNPAVAEFIPRQQQAAAPSSAMETTAETMEEAMPRVRIFPRREPEQQQVSEPIPSSSTRASVAPTTKRQREMETRDEDTESKKAKTSVNQGLQQEQHHVVPSRSDEEDIVVLDSGDDEAEEEEPQQHQPISGEEEGVEEEDNVEEGDEEADGAGFEGGEEEEDEEEEEGQEEGEEDVGTTEMQDEEVEDDVQVVEDDDNPEESGAEEGEIMIGSDNEGGVPVQQQYGSNIEMSPSSPGRNLVIDENDGDGVRMVDNAGMGGIQSASASVSAGMTLGVHDDGVVPSTPKFSMTRPQNQDFPPADSVHFPQVPQGGAEEPSFDFSVPDASELAAASTGLISQQGFDQTSFDFDQFAPSGDLLGTEGTFHHLVETTAASPSAIAGDNPQPSGSGGPFTAAAFEGDEENKGQEADMAEFEDSQDAQTSSFPPLSSTPTASSLQQTFSSDGASTTARFVGADAARNPSFLSRAIRVTRTPIIWDNPSSSSSAPQQPPGSLSLPIAGRGGISARGLGFRGRGSNKAKRSKGHFDKMME